MIVRSQPSEDPIGASWSERYGDRHKLLRIKEFPPGITPPKKVRIYARTDHYVLQAWDPAAKGTISERVEGDFLAALIRAREIDERIVNFRRTGVSSSRLRHAELVAQYLSDLRERTEAGEIDPRTVQRYDDALQHYLAFTETEPAAKYPNIQRADRSFQLALAAFLRTSQITANGRVNGTRKPMVRCDYITDVVRAMYCWAADPQRGNLLGDGFLNPFLRSPGGRAQQVADPTAEPPITLPMAADFLAHCDEWQMPVFTGLLFWGLRPSELGWLFREDLTKEWIWVRCRPELEYFTKGRRDKRVPIVPTLADLWTPLNVPGRGLLFRARQAPAQSPSLEELTAEFRHRTQKRTSAAERRAVRDQFLRTSGALTYDQVEGEFRRVAETLLWPRSATLKGFRHLFATTLENGGMPEFYRRFLMAQSPGRSAIVTYTHLNQVKSQYERVVSSELSTIVEVVQRQFGKLNQKSELAADSAA